MIRTLPFACFVLLLGIGACDRSPFALGSEPLRAGPPGPGDSSGGAPGHPDDPALVPVPQEVRTQGVVTEVPSRLGTYAFLIEEHPDRALSHTSSPLTHGGKYHVGVTESTVIRRRGQGGQIAVASLDDIGVGTHAEVWFAGPILESYPAQGTAARIMIFDSIP